ncbi:hypothetical protein LRS37_07135 [Neobacillus sedimentimangrovi]|uniref:Uncharacterized protein n=1 Tax=Neobacillus sedimentimangrovi TaxID=2699460 RepID=A0ABS8QJ64_9BACI|nr:hypothetical protein [Neobacillus sedimentimangrovi]MCD4838649.1 hypothetical protein [Neobacillus sedimentimangrovi]
MKIHSSIIIGLSIIIGFTILGIFLMVTVDKFITNKGNVNNEYKYELVPANENNMIIFDRKTGEYWTKFIPSEEGSTNWEKGDSPLD